MFCAGKTIGAHPERRRQIPSYLLPALCCVCLWFTAAPGVVHRVAPGASISAALAAAGPFDTVIVAAGTYVEQLHITKPVYLAGEDYPHIRGGYVGHTVLVSADRTVLNGLRISEAGTRLIEDMACVRIEADSVTVRSCRIDESLHGIYVKGGSYAELHDNRIEGRRDLREADRGNGIHLWNSRHNRLHDNEILYVRDGIYFSFADSTHCFRNRIHHVRYGLHYMYSNDNQFTANLFTENVAGAALMYSQRINFFRNVFAHCRGFRAYGILYQSMDYTVAEYNLILDNSRGMFFNNSDHGRLIRNDVVDNDLAIQLNGSCEGNLLAENNFIGNLSSVLVDRQASQTSWAVGGRGNYWSDYRGYDLDGDGVGDVEHRIENIFQVAEAKSPEVRFYLLSPAAEILEIAERALPILELGFERDPFPIFRPVPNDSVPWDAALPRAARNGFPAATVYAVLSLIPLTFLWRRHGPRRRERTTND